MSDKTEDYLNEEEIFGLIERIHDWRPTSPCQDFSRRQLVGSVKNTDIEVEIASGQLDPEKGDFAYIRVRLKAYGPFSILGESRFYETWDTYKYFQIRDLTTKLYRKYESEIRRQRAEGVIKIRSLLQS